MPSKNKNGVPDRWTDYKALGKRIHGTRFIAFKVPLNQSFRYKLPQSEVFGPLDLVRLLEKDGQQLGLVIDLTFTKRYYSIEDLPDTLYHLKIFTAGHEVPKNATILSFKKAVRHFLRDNENNDKLIGVHCTHGLNRTGYLICRYLIDVEGMTPQNAIDLFNESRGHSIERQNYLEDLTMGEKRSNAGMDEPDQEPVRGLVGSLHRRERNHHNPPFNRQGAYDWHRDTQREFPFHQRNNLPPFGHVEHHSFRPPLFPHPPLGVRPMGPGFPNHGGRGFYHSPLNSFPHSLPPYRFGEPYHNPYLPPEGSTGPPGPHRKQRHRHRKGPNDWTPH